MSEKQCDMKDTELCQYYQIRKECHYLTTHGIKNCPYETIEDDTNDQTNMPKKQ